MSKRKKRIGSWGIYGERNKILLEMGFPNYSAYLASDLWKSIRDRVFRKRGRDCFLCGKFAVSVHHNKYTSDNLSGRRISHLFPVCLQCHKDVEFNGKKKSPPNSVFSRFNKQMGRRANELSEMGLPRHPKGAPYRKPTEPIPAHLYPKTDGTMALITIDLVMAIRSQVGGWNRHQLKAIGVSWPPKKGWMEQFRNGVQITLRNWEVAVANIKRENTWASG